MFCERFGDRRNMTGLTIISYDMRHLYISEVVFLPICKEQGLSGMFSKILCELSGLKCPRKDFRPTAVGWG